MPPTIAPFPVSPELAAVAIAYKNTSLIADRVLPRVPVNKEVFKYREYSLEEGFTVPDTKVGRRSKPNEVTFSADEKESSTHDYGLDDPIPNADIENAPEGYDPLAQAVQTLMELILLDREVRTSDLVFDASNYGTDNKETLTGTDQFSDAGSKPIEVIMDSLESMVMRGNKMVIGSKPWSVLRRHADIVKAVQGNAGDTGVASQQAVANLFELDEVIVGRARVNTAKKGQPVSLSKTWGDSLVLFYQNEMALPQNNLVTFGFTAQWGDRVAGSENDSNIGLRGGKRVRSGESVRELIIADDLAYMVNDLVA